MKKTKKTVWEDSAYAIVDVRKKTPRLCYATMESTVLYSKGLAAIYYKKPRIAKAWIPFKKVVPCTITYEL